MTRRLARLGLAVLLVGATVGAGAPAIAAETPTPGASSPGTDNTDLPISASVTVGSGKPGDIVKVVGSGWPGRITIQASTCGNNAVDGATDCDQSGAGSTITQPDGTFSLDMPVGKPPKPCPCVVHVVSPDTSAVVNSPFVVTGQPTGSVVINRSTRTLEAEARLTGSGPFTAWLGGAAKRTYILTVRNTGSTALTNPGLTLTVGKGADPTNLLAAPQIGTVAPGQTLQYRLPVTLKAPAFGQYRVKAYFSDLDKPVTVVASTSSYPWLLFLLGWLLLQPLLLGLYKRRPVAEGGDEDPFAPGVADLPPLVPVAAGAMAYADDPLLGEPAPSYAYAGSGYGAAAPLAVGAAAGTAIVPRVASPLVPNYRPVFGVTDLRAYLDPHNMTPPASVAPRIVLGGVVPRALPNGSAPHQ